MSWYNPSGTYPGQGAAVPGASMGGAATGGGMGGLNSMTLMQRIMQALGNPSMNNLMGASNAMFSAGAPRSLPAGGMTPQGGGGGAPGAPQMQPAQSTLSALAPYLNMGGQQNQAAGQAGAQQNPQLQQYLAAIQQLMNRPAG